MTSAQMYELARLAVKESAGEDPAGSMPDVLWVGGVLEDRRAVVWYLGKLYMVRHNTSTDQTWVDSYIKEG